MVAGPGCILDRKLVRDLWAFRGQALSIVLVLACAAAAVAMSFSARRSLDATREDYYRQYAICRSVRLGSVRAPVARRDHSSDPRRGGGCGADRRPGRDFDRWLRRADHRSADIAAGGGRSARQRPGAATGAATGARSCRGGRGQRELSPRRMVLLPGSRLALTLGGRKASLRCRYRPFAGVHLCPRAGTDRSRRPSLRHCLDGAFDAGDGPRHGRPVQRPCPPARSGCVGRCRDRSVGAAAGLLWWRRYP